MAMTVANDENSNSHDDNLETFGLLWLDAAVNTSEENREAQHQLRSTINHVTTFEDASRCQQYIRSICIHDRLVLIVSGQLGQEVVPQIHQIRQLSSIYVYCMDKQRNEKWARNFAKVKAVTVQLDDLISRIKADQKKRVKVEDPIVINIFTVDETPDQSTTGLNGGFVHSLLLIDVLLRMKCVEKDKQELVKICKKAYKNNTTELNILREFQEEYSPKEALWWYTRESFLYKMLNKALRVQNIDMLFLFHFFICDIHRELERNQCQSPVHVYRGQALSNDELSNLRKSIGRFISINSFFSTTSNRHQALKFLNSLDILDDLHRVLFEIDADPRVVTTKPFADISSFSDFVNESEVLFMIGSIFRLTDVRRNNDQTWIVRLVLCNDDEHDLRTLFEYLKKSYGGGDKRVDLLTFGKVLRRMGKFDLAEKFYRRVLNDLPSDDPLLSNLYYLLALVLKDKDELDSSLEYLHQSLEIELKTCHHSYKSVSNTYNAIGNVHRQKGHYNVALSWYNKAIELFEKENATDQPNMAHFYNNMALVYKKQENYSKALDFNKKALIIREKYLPANHSDIAISHNNIAGIHHCLGDYDLALKHQHQSLKIKTQSLPPLHPEIAKSYGNIGLVYEGLDKPKQALEYFQKAASIYRQSLSSQHPDVIRIEKDIKRISFELE